MRRAVQSAATALTAVVLVLVAWLLFVPEQLGGATRYAVVEGASMEPRLSSGDLVLVRARGEPSVGDVVLYRDPLLDVRVLHRVVRTEGDRLVLQGDANDFVDDARPRRDEVIGSYWFSIPRAGSALHWLGQPLHAALAAFLLTIVALAGGSPTGRGKHAELGAR
jgi:signal peptidase I